MNSFWHHFTIAVVTATSMLGPNVIYVLEVSSILSIVMIPRYTDTGDCAGMALLGNDDMYCSHLSAGGQNLPIIGMNSFSGPTWISCLLCLYWLRDSLTTARAAHEVYSCLCFWSIDVTNLQNESLIFFIITLEETV